MKLRGVEVSKNRPLSSLLHQICEVAWEALAVVRFVLSPRRAVRRDVYKTGDGLNPVPASVMYALPLTVSRQDMHGPSGQSKWRASWQPHRL